MLDWKKKKKKKTLPTLPFFLNPLSENQNIFSRWPKEAK
jgi:hypothetical protein